MEDTHNNPYVGPRTFEEWDKDYFFGRENEAQALLALVLAQREVLFYATSGAGKSSLINTRLIPALRDHLFTPLRGRMSLGSQLQVEGDVGNVFVFSLISSLSPEVDSSDLRSLTLAEYLSKYHQLPAYQDDQPLEPARMLIIDQFEELFTTNQAYWEQRESFFMQLAEASNQDRLLWILLVIREDYVTALERYARLAPNKLRVRYHMERMRADAALEAIRAPAAKAGRPFVPPVGAAKGPAELLLNDLQQVRVVGTENTIRGEFVEPVQLQLVCYSLWEALRETPGNGIMLADIEATANVDKTLADYYDSAIDTVVSQTGVEEQALRDLFGQQLITETDTRGLIFRGDAQTNGIDNSAIDILDKQFFLLRSSTIGGGTWYELVHDRFIPAIRQSNELAWVRLEKERQAYAIEAERKQEESKWRRRILFYVIPVTALLTVVGIAVLLRQNHDLTVAQGVAAAEAATAVSLAAERNALLEQQRQSLIDLSTRLAQSEVPLADTSEASMEEAEEVLDITPAIQSTPIVAATGTKVLAETLEGLATQIAVVEVTQTAIAQVEESFFIGYSIDGTPIRAIRLGSGPKKIVMVGGIHAGLAPNTVDLAEQTVEWFLANPEEIPSSVTIYVVPNLNPDSLLAPGQIEGRYNANGVDLNRNWNCNWTEDPIIRGTPQVGRGGDAPLSEPETTALANFLRDEVPDAVLFWDAPAAGGGSIPGGCPGTNEEASRLAQAYSEQAGYAYREILYNYIEGDASNWLDAIGIPAFFVLLPNTDGIDWENNLRGIQRVVDLVSANRTE